MKQIIKEQKFFCVIALLILPFGILAQSQAKAPKIKNIIVVEEEFSKDFQGKMTDSETYFDQSGNIIEEKEFKNGKIKTHLKNEYDTFGNKTKVIELDESGKILKSTVYKYDKNLKTEKLVYDAKSKLTSKKTYNYKYY